MYKYLLVNIYIYHLFIILSEVRLISLGIAATTRLLYQPQLIDKGDCGAIGGMKMAGETEVLGKNLAQHHFVHHKSHMIRLGLEPWPPLWEVCD
jgi:hypothetical protein